ncbi:MAG: V-type ATP synthase subunit F [Acholeplasmataceae bacterium]|jgi:V/A-type H+-transporting ATPase subunit F|nr:V-type ATP synthase subunit F [Acholeplasmataceae bacterium]
MNDRIDIAAIGSDDTILLFNAVGIKTYTLSDPLQVDKTIFQLSNQKCRIIYVSEEIYQAIPETLEKYKTAVYPIIIPIPTKTESKEIGLEKIKENVEKAIGFDIF